MISARVFSNLTSKFAMSSFVAALKFAMSSFVAAAGNMGSPFAGNSYYVPSLAIHSGERRIDNSLLLPCLAVQF